jgi:phosphohistidine swiveling domain-containing protein
MRNSLTPRVLLESLACRGSLDQPGCKAAVCGSYRVAVHIVRATLQDWIGPQEPRGQFPLVTRVPMTHLTSCVAMPSHPRARPVVGAHRSRRTLIHIRRKKGGFVMTNARTVAADPLDLRQNAHLDAHRVPVIGGGLYGWFGAGCGRPYRHTAVSVGIGGIYFLVGLVLTSAIGFSGASIASPGVYLLIFSGVFTLDRMQWGACAFIQPLNASRGAFLVPDEDYVSAMRTLLRRMSAWVPVVALFLILFAAVAALIALSTLTEAQPAAAIARWLGILPIPSLPEAWFTQPHLAITLVTLDWLLGTTLFGVVAFLSLTAQGVVGWARVIQRWPVMPIPSAVRLRFVGFASFAARAGGHVLLPESVYAPNRDIANRLLPHLGIETEYYVLLSDGTEPMASGVSHGQTVSPSGGQLQGTAASPGVVTGSARVIRDPAGARLEPGEILVAPSTDPGWTPLFLTARGLVMEFGGAMAHGAIVAREYGLPAVVGAGDTTARLHNGQLVTVDGSAGVVEAALDEAALDEAAAAAEVGPWSRGAPGPTTSGSSLADPTLGSAMPALYMLVLADRSHADQTHRPCHVRSLCAGRRSRSSDLLTCLFPA